ncbi:MAG: hypothetical protein HQK65_05840 [Desulfamplus sp.]|nr:hypothetical protein [Desulfamplus sp.]
MEEQTKKNSADQQKKKYKTPELIDYSTLVRETLSRPWSGGVNDRGSS